MFRKKASRFRQNFSNPQSCLPLIGGGVMKFAPFEKTETNFYYFDPGRVWVRLPIFISCSEMHAALLMMGGLLFSIG